MDKETVIKAAFDCADFEELADKLGIQDVESLVLQVCEEAPDVELIMERCEVYREMKECARIGDSFGRKEAHGRFLDLTIKLLEEGYCLEERVKLMSGKNKLSEKNEDNQMSEKNEDLELSGKNHDEQMSGESEDLELSGEMEEIMDELSEEMEDLDKQLSEKIEEVNEELNEYEKALLVDILKKKRPRLKFKEVKQLKKVLDPLGDEPIDCLFLKSDILGYIPRDIGVQSEICGKRILVMVNRPNVFGEEVVVDKGDGKVGIRRATLNNGILNQCNIKDEYPTPYWAVLDIMTELKTFSKDMIIDKCVEVYGDQRDKGSYESLEDFRNACVSAFYVLKDHHKHPMKMYSGCCFMVVHHGSMDVNKFTIRSRERHETLEFFENLGKVKVAGAPMVSLE